MSTPLAVALVVIAVVIVVVIGIRSFGKGGDDSAKLQQQMSEQEKAMLKGGADMPGAKPSKPGGGGMPGSPPR